MLPRREFAKYAAATVATVAAAIPISEASARSFSNRRNGDVRSAVRRDETIVRHGGNGDIFPLTWMRDGLQFCSFSDGFGWSTAPKGIYNTQGLWIEGGPAEAEFHEVATYPGVLSEDFDHPRYYGFSALAVKNRLYQILCRMYRGLDSKLSWNGVKLIYSPDQGRSWHNQDGSTPVIWESEAEQARRGLLFFEEPQQAFSLVSLLQMGKGYAANRDGYAYGYGINGTVDGVMNQLVMFRAPTSRMLDRNGYEFFGGLKSGGRANWVKGIQARAVVHTFPRGWVNDRRKEPCLAQSWLPSVVYNTALGTYLMAASGIGCSSDGEWSKASYFGLWTASDPWGPWTQVLEETAWTPNNELAARCYSPQISPKWFSPDGKSFWLVWSDLQSKCDASESAKLEENAQRNQNPRERARFRSENSRRCSPYYAFNTQRVDLVS